MVLKKLAIFALKNISGLDDEATIKAKKILIDLFENNEVYQENKSFFMRLSQYYFEHKKFTKVQLNALERLKLDG